MPEQWDGREGLDRPSATCVKSTTRPRSSPAFADEDGMPLKTFGYSPKRIACDTIDSISKYEHSFGGSLKDFGIEVVDAPLPLHLIYRLDLADPLLSIALPGVNFLPLLFPFSYGCECGYTVRSDVLVEFHQFYKEASPPWDAPLEFPRSKTSFTIEQYDPRDVKHALSYKGVFGWGELSPADRKIAVKLAAKTYGLSRADAPDDDWDLESVVECMCYPPFVQRGVPLGICLNPSCDSNAEMRVIAIQDKCVPQERIWPSEYSQTIWQSCPSCGSIHVSNRST